MSDPLYQAVTVVNAAAESQGLWSILWGGFKDLLPSGITFLFAYLGLSSWRKELHGRTRFELAMKLLRGVYLLRDAIDAYRCASMFPGEMPGISVLSPAEEQAKARVSAYQVRWQKVAAAVNEIDLVAYEAEAIMGKSAANVIRELKMLVGELSIATTETFQLEQLQKREKDQQERLTEQMSIFRSSGTDSDAWRKKLLALISELEALAKPIVNG